MDLQPDQHDIVVVGAGIAGLVAGAEAARRGARVTILDKLPTMLESDLSPPGRPANDTARSGGGGLAHWSYEAPVEELLEAHLERGWGRVDAHLVRAYLERVVADCLWLRDDLGMPFEGGRVSGRGRAICPFLYKVAQASGANILFSTKALKLLIQGTRVAGVKAAGPSGEVDLQAHVVVLATGSFQGNEEMMLKYLGRSMAEEILHLGSPANTGDGHLMAMEAGAQMTNLSAAHLGTTDKLSGKGPAHPLANICRTGIFVNREGNRFLDESMADADTLSNAIFHQAGRRAALVFDDKVRASHAEEYQNCPDKDQTIFKTESLEGLALHLGISADLLEQTLTDFNGALKDGRLVGAAVPKTSMAFPIDSPPYYAFYPVLPALDHPLGGLKINARAQVLDRDNQPIPGLCAAGSLVNWAYGKAYEAGGVKTFKGNYSAGMSSGLPIALVFGRIAGQSAADEVLRAGLLT